MAAADELEPITFPWALSAVRMSEKKLNLINWNKRLSLLTVFKNTNKRKCTTQEIFNWAVVSSNSLERSLVFLLCSIYLNILFFEIKKIV